MSYRILSIICAVMFSVCSLSGCAGGGSSEPAEASGSAPVASEEPSAPAAGNDGGAGSAELTWESPSTNDDGTSLSDLSGFKVHYGTASGNYTSTLSVGRVSTFLVTGLAPGTYYFAVTALNSAGVESDFSNEIAKEVS